MSQTSFVPIIIGVGDIKNTSRKPEDAVEPMLLMAEAIRTATEDAGFARSEIPKILEQLDCVNVVDTWTWKYKDLPGLLATHFGANPAHKHYSEIGGDKPVKLLDDVLRKIVLGQSSLAVVTGGEALASLATYFEVKKRPPPWTDADQAMLPLDRELPPGLNAKHGLGKPIQVYPLYENAFRYHKSQSIQQNHHASAQIYAKFAEVAANVEVAWSHGKPPVSVTDIENVTKRNRMICFPYPLLMNAFNMVNMAAACIVTSTDRARALGVPEDRWIYILGAAGTSESGNLWERPSYNTSASINRSLDATLRTSNVRVEDVDLFDIYSCFPIVPKLAATHLGLATVSSPKPLSVLGGLTSFGGAGNNYSLHAVNEMTRLMRRGKGNVGLVLANGGVLTYHHAICLSTRPPSAGHDFPERNPLKTVIDDIPIPVINMEPEGMGVIETYTVDFGRNGQAVLGHVIGRLWDGSRFVANHADAATLKELSSWTKEPIGRNGYVTQGPKGNNLFRLERDSHL